MTKQTADSTTSIAKIFRLFIKLSKRTDDTSPILYLSKILYTGLAHLESKTEEKLSFREAALQSLENRRWLRPSTVADLRSYINRFLIHAEWAGRDIRTISKKECRYLLEQHFSKSGHVFSKAKAILHSIFNFAIRRDCCSKNPVKGIDSIPIKETPIKILTIRQISAFMRALKAKDMQCMHPAVCLMLWCGIRPTEVQRLKWKDVDFQEKVVYVDGQASKTGGARAVPLRGAAAHLKSLSGPPDDLVAPCNWIRLWGKLRRRAGMRVWQKDAMRHTFASMHLKHFHNIQLLQEEMGHRDSTLLRTRYLNLRNLSSKAASQFFNWQE